MRVLLSAMGSRGDVEPMAGLAVRRLAAVAAAAQGCDALVATGLFPAAAAVRSVAEKLSICYVYVGFGSMPMRASKDVARVAIEAIRAQGCRVLVSRGWADLALIDDRDDCFGVGEVNQQALFGRVAGLGVGTAHDGPTPTTESLSAALRTALTPETRARATAVADAVRTDGAAVAATLLVDAVSRERPPVSA